MFIINLSSEIHCTDKIALHQKIFVIKMGMPTHHPLLAPRLPADICWLLIAAVSSSP